jgi:iron(III) transport system ATP-binding protein
MRGNDAATGAGVAVRGLTKSFEARSVLRGVDLDIAEGTLTAVLGPSGCGKTTLLRIVAGFETPDVGTVTIGGETVCGSGISVPAHRRRIGLMPQEGALFPHLSAAENVAFGLPRDQRGDAERVVRHWLKVVGLDGTGAARPHELSGGQQQRVALARALAARPRVLLLDEPFAALDAGLRGRVREDIVTILRETGTTAILVTHDQPEALSLADAVALLMAGRVVQAGSPADLYDRPATLTAARFVGAAVEVSGECRAGMVRTALGVHPVRLPVGDGEVVAVLRPEQLRLDGDDGARARVTANRFYGPDRAVHVVLADGTPLVLRRPGDVAVEPGREVTVRVEGAVLAYPSPPGGQRVALGEAGG